MSDTEAPPATEAPVQPVAEAAPAEEKVVEPEPEAEAQAPLADAPAEDDAPEGAPEEEHTGINPAQIEEEEEEDEEKKPGEKKAGRRKINIEFIEDKSRRHITFSKRKAGIMKKAYELSALTGTQVLLLVASETGHVYTYATEKLQPLIQKPEGKNLIQTCLSAPDVQPQDAIAAAPDGSQYAAMAAAAAAAAANSGERPNKQRKLAGGAQQPGSMYGLPQGMNALYGAGGRNMPQYGGQGATSAGGAGRQQGLGGYGNMGVDPRGLPGMPGMPSMPQGMQGLSPALLQGLMGGMPGGGNTPSSGAGGGMPQLQGLNPALLQGLMSGQLPSAAMMGMDGSFGANSIKLEALQQTINDASNQQNHMQ